MEMALPLEGALKQMQRRAGAFCGCSPLEGVTLDILRLQTRGRAQGGGFTRKKWDLGGFAAFLRAIL